MPGTTTNFGWSKPLGTDLASTGDEVISSALDDIDEKAAELDTVDADEATTRATADTALSGLISAEAAARAAADTAEATARANADTAHTAAGDPHPSYLTTAEGNAAYDAIGAAAAAQAASQPVDSDLTAIAALSTTAYGRAFLALADAAAGRTALALGTAATQASGAFDAAGAASAAQAASQPLDSDLTAIAALSTTSFGRGLLALADAAALGAAHDHSATYVALGTLASALLGQFVGERSGVPVQPASPPPPFGPELAVVANLVSGGGYNVTLPIPTLTANSTVQNSRTLVSLGNIANADLAFRVRMNVVSMPTNGWASLKLRIVDSGGNVLAGSVEQMLANNGAVMTGWYDVDFKANSAWTLGSAYLEVRLDLFNNASAGTLQVASLSVREIAAPQRPMLFGQFGGTPGSVPTSGYMQVYQPLFDPVSGIWRMVGTDLSADSALLASIGPVLGFNTTRPFLYDRLDPDFVAACAAVTEPINRNQVSLGAGEVQRSLRSSNNDQVIEVRKASLSYELRGNTHGGETLRSNASPDLVYAHDQGDGTWVPYTGDGNTLRTCRRFRFTFKTKMARSAPDSDDFANVDHVATFFPDGMMRMDRTTTFLKAMRVGSLFEWMSSHSITTPQIGRIGAGLLVLDEVDAYAKVATPAAPTVTTNTSGGTLAAAAYVYSVTAFAQGGETDASPTGTVTSTGTTSTNTVAWSAVTNAEGYRIYGRKSGVGIQTLLATVGAGTLSWDDTGAVPPTGQTPPPANRARRIDSATTAMDSAVSDKATWAVWYDQIAGICFGNIYDRDAVLNRTGVAGVKVRLEQGSGIRKNYLNVAWTGDGSPNLPYSESRLVPLGEVWTATHWAFAYVPADRDEYHREIAVRAVNLDALAAMYPAT